MIKHLIKDVICLDERDKCTFIYDSNFTNLLPVIKAECDQISVTCDFYKLDYEYGKELPDILSDLLLGDTHNAFIFGQKENIWHTKERKKAKYKLQKRLVNLVSSSNWLLSREPEKIDLIIIKRLGDQIKNIFSPGSNVKIESDKGTSLTAIINSKAKIEKNKKYGPFLDACPYDFPGSGGDFPSGEVGFGPQLNSVNGRVVLDLKIQNVGFLKEPIVITIQNDQIRQVDRKDIKEVHKYKDLLEKHESFKYICEISFGLNPYVKFDEDIKFIPEEKILGTMHFGHGGNLSYGDRLGPHFDGVMNRPTLYVENQLIIRNGQFVSNMLDGEVFNWLKNLDAIFPF